MQYIETKEVKNMESEILATEEIKEEYTTSKGNKQTRNHVLRTMSNNGSLFLNYRCGKQSVNISKGAWEQIQKTNLTWEQKQNSKTEQTLLQHLQQLQKQINELKKQG